MGKLEDKMDATIARLDRMAARQDAADIGLWVYNEITGYWKLERSCSSENADTWLKHFQQDAPGKKFKLSKTKPR